MTKRLFTVVGGQFGSEAKGHVAAQLANAEIVRGNRVWAVRVAGHNAGHTSYDSRGQAFALRTIPCMAVVDPDVQCFIAAGSELALDVLAAEVQMLEEGGHEIRHRLFIDPEATVIEQHHIDAETDATMHERLGSTGKGVGAARADRLMRKARRWGDLPSEETNGYLQFHSQKQFKFDNVPHDVSIILEGTQGYGLGLHAGMYPFCTSSNTRSIDFLAMAAIYPERWIELGTYEPVVVCRTYPIRVAGNSGPLDDVTWEELAEQSEGYIKPERTTVTKKIRRIGNWDPQMVADALDANGGTEVASLAITFVDYLDPAVAGETSLDYLLKSDAVRGFLDQVRQIGYVKMVTTGPDTVVWYE